MVWVDNHSSTSSLDDEGDNIATYENRRHASRRQDTELSAKALNDEVAVDDIVESQESSRRARDKDVLCGEKGLEF